MVNDRLLIEQDLRHVWHPCSQMKDFEQCPPLIVHKAKGSYLHTNNGPIIDAISSWWCKSLGHGHPKVIDAIQDQLSRFEHVIGANTTNQFIVELAVKLKEISGKQHVFFASDGSSAVEIALKLALAATNIKGFQKRNQFISLKHGYHGETLATLSVSDVATFKNPLSGIGLHCHHLQNIPYVSGITDSLWNNCQDIWEKTEQELNAVKENVCAIIVEPIVQGAGGMRCYSQDFLKRLALWAQKNDIYLIADEIMTGFGRTGKWLACQHAQINPDLICLSKGLTSGTIPLSCILIDSAIYDLFYHDYDKGSSFLHSHTHSGNPLAIRAALATIDTIHQEGIINRARSLGVMMHQYFNEIANTCGKLQNIRSIGAMVAGDLIADTHERKGFSVYQEALQKGALLRPLGNTIYWLPPLNTDEKTIAQLAEITLNSIQSVYT